MHSIRAAPRRRLNWRLPAFVLLLASQPAGPAWAWGPRGHRIVARIAAQHLSDRAKAEIHDLLENGESLADASTWADEHQRDIRGSAPWHYVSVPLDEPRYDRRFAANVAG